MFGLERFRDFFGIGKRGEGDILKPPGSAENGEVKRNLAFEVKRHRESIAPQPPESPQMRNLRWEGEHKPGQTAAQDKDVEDIRREAGHQRESIPPQPPESPQMRALRWEGEHKPGQTAAQDKDVESLKREVRRH